jgi:hypothetical protein
MFVYSSFDGVLMQTVFSYTDNIYLFISYKKTLQHNHNSLQEVKAPRFLDTRHTKADRQTQLVTGTFE